METYTCIETPNQLNLKKIIKAGKYKSHTDEHGKTSDYIHKQLLAIQRATRRTGSQQVCFVVKNKLSKNKCIGRLWPKHNKACLQSLPRDVRKALCYDRYSDVDICNAHPTILYQLFKRHGLYSDLLENYILNRDQVLQDIDSCRQSAKEDINKAVNCGVPRSQYGKNLYIELMDCYEALLSLDEFQDYRKWGEIANGRNPVGSAINSLLSDWERRAVSVAIHKFQELGYTTSTIIHDGFLVEHLDVDSSVLEVIESEIQRKVGLDIKLSIKNMIDYDQSRLWDEDVQDVDDSEMGDVDAAELFYERMTGDGHVFVRCGGLFFWYNPEEGIWTQDLMLLRRYMKELPGQYGQMTRKQDMMLVQLKAMFLEDCNFMKNSTRGFIPFNNGVWDFQQRRLLPFDSKFFFDKKLPWDFGDVDEQLVQEIRDKLIDGVFGKLGEYYLRVLARAIAGNVEDKNFIVAIGDSNSGKGCNTDALFGAFPGFVANINASNFAYKKSDGDGAKNRSWMVGCSRARALVCNEISMKDPLDGNIIKTVSSGGDPITARQNYRDEVEFVMAGTAFVFANDIPEISPMDDAVQNRMRYVETAYSYLDGHMYESKKRLEHVRLADPELKTVFLKRPEVLRTFALMVCSAWEPQKPIAPEEVIKASKEWTEADDVETKLSELFEVSDNSEDYITSEQVRYLVERAKLNLSAVKVGRVMTKLGFKSVDKRFDKKVKKVYMGLKVAGFSGVVEEEY